jgi:hypothetical protein
MLYIYQFCECGSAFILVGWIRIRNRSTDPDPGVPKMTHNSKENSSLEVLDVLFEGMKTSPLALAPFMEA